MIPLRVQLMQQSTKQLYKQNDLGVYIKHPQILTRGGFDDSTTKPKRFETTTNDDAQKRKRSKP